MSLLSTGLSGLSHATPIFLVAAALTLVLDATRLLDLSQAALAGLAAALATRFPLDPALAFVGMPVALAGVGAALDQTLYRRLTRTPLTSQLLVMLGLFLLIHDAAGLLQTNAAPPLPGRPWANLVIPAIGLAIFGLLRLLPRDPRAGQRHLMVPIAAALSGLAGTSSLLVEPAASTAVDLSLLTGASLAVVLGGLGSLAGTFLAAIVVALLQAFAAGLFPGSSIAIPLVITGVLLLIRPTGLFAGARPAPVHRPSSLTIRPAPRSARLLFAMLLLLAAAAPILAPAALPSITDVALAILFAASLHLLLGPGGIPSLGHAAFFGIGAAAAALLTQRTDMLAVGLAIGSLTAGLVALMVGLVLARTSALVVVMLTLVAAQLVWTVAPSAWPIVTRAAPLSAVGFWLTLGICIGVALILRRLVYAPFGYALRAARDDPARAAASGLPVVRLHGTAFFIAGTTAGLAGALSIMCGGAVGSTPALERSGVALLMLALGGVQAIGAPLVGALAFGGAASLLPASPVWHLLLGPALIAIPLLLPHGIAGASVRFWRRAA